MALAMTVIGLVLSFVLIWSLCRAAAQADRQMEKEWELLSHK